jgi:quercetin dioxygenase-like cupin family protein
MVEAYAFAGTTMTVVVPGAVTGGAFTVLHVIKPSGSSTPPHSHDSETEVSYVLSGTLGVDTEGRRRIVAAGACVVLPSTRPHRLFNDSGAPVREFLLCAPALFDRLVAAVGTPVGPYAQPTAMTDEDQQRLVATAAKFGIQLLPSATPRGAPREPAPSTSETIEIPGARIEVLARLGSADTDLVLLRGSIAPGLSLTLSGQRDQGCIFIIDGELEVLREDVPGGPRRLGAEAAIYVGPDTRHVAHAVGAAPVTLLMVTTERMLGLFATVGSAVAGTPELGD